jgi:simple sugar transport system ATP-binding protein
VTAALELSAISKSFDGFKALSDATFSASAGEVHALLGENGAGKSSLMNVAAGHYVPDSGDVTVFGQSVAIAGPMAARRLGIGMVHQHYKLVKAFNAIENVLMSRRRAGYATGLDEVAKELRMQCDAVGFEVDLRRPVGSLSVAEQQRIEILKVLVEGARILILDEPTAVLTDQEAERLLAMMRRLADRGATVILVTHKLGEVKRHADRVTVMRSGATIGSADPASLSVAELTTMIVGANVSEAPRRSVNSGEAIVRIESLAGCRADGHRTLVDANFELRGGEIYGIAGVGGNGQAELFEIITGIRGASAGRITMVGAGDVTTTSPCHRRAPGLVSIPADRHSYGLAGELTVAENYAVNGVLSGRFGGWLKVDRRAIQAKTEEAIRVFDVHGVRDHRQKVSLLSGGNAQKLVIAREFSEPPRIVLAHSPSRGLDVRASAEVHRRLREARDAGAGILLISEDLDEILLLSDRIGVMNRGRIVSEFTCPVDRGAVGAAMVHHA